MQTVGIIAEFNPFHHGHAHLLHTVRAQGADMVICAMSGPFTQRGEAALCNKWTRARMAVANGADLVVELPFFYASRSAYDFASGGIHLLHALGITHLAFGCEYHDSTLLEQMAAILVQEPPSYVENLHKSLQAGQGFAAARAAAIQTYFPEKSEVAAVLLRSPNAILALEYLHVLQETAFPIQPWLVPRQGAGYHDQALQRFASAQAIRSHFYRLANEPLSAQEALKPALPTSSWDLLQEEKAMGRCPFQTTALDIMVLSRLRMISNQELKMIFEMREGLENRLKNAAFSCGTIEELVQTVSGRRYPRSRIRRLLLYVLLGVTQELATTWQKQSSPVYAHVLAANQQGLLYMKHVKKTSDLTFLSSGRELRSFLHATQGSTPEANALLQLDLQASALYSLGYPNPSQRVGDPDFRQCGILS